MRKFLIAAAAVAGGAACFLAGVAVAADQPHMFAALDALRTARQEILAADAYHDHGGHAGAATGLIDQAIGEVKAGIEYRNQHGP